jgi:hypothetical protein
MSREPSTYRVFAGAETLGYVTDHWNGRFTAALINGRDLGQFDSEEDATRAVREAASKPPVITPVTSIETDDADNHPARVTAPVADLTDGCGCLNPVGGGADDLPCTGQAPADAAGPIHSRPDEAERSVTHTVEVRHEIGERVAELLEQVSQNPARRRELLTLGTNIVCDLIDEGSLSPAALIECVKGNRRKQQQKNNFVVNAALGFVEGDDDEHKWTGQAPKTETARKNLAHALKKCQRAAVAITDMRATRKVHEGALVIDGDGVAKRFGKSPVRLDGSRIKDSKITHSIEQCTTFAVEDHAPKAPPESPITPWQRVDNFLREVKKRESITAAEQRAAEDINGLLADILDLPVVDPVGREPRSLTETISEEVAPDDDRSSNSEPMTFTYAIDDHDKWTRERLTKEAIARGEKIELGEQIIRLMCRNPNQDLDSLVHQLRRLGLQGKRATVKARHSAMREYLQLMKGLYLISAGRREEVSLAWLELFDTLGERLGYQPHEFAFSEKGEIIIPDLQ